MKVFIGRVKAFNGKYWREAEVKIEASSFSAAVQRAATQMPKRKGERITQVIVALEVLCTKQIQIAEEEEEALTV